MRIIGIAGLVGLLLAGSAYSFTYAMREGAPRDITLIAKDMAFTVDRPAVRGMANPTIVLHAGERVRLVLRNEDPGMRHDLIVEHLSLRTDALDFRESDGIVFKVPERKGEGDYYCSFHSQLMRGRIVVR